MKTKPFLYLSTSLIALFMLLVPLVAAAAPPGVLAYGQGDYLDVSKKTWIEYAQPVVDPLGHPERPWQPKEEYPFKQPYTGVELMYLSWDDHWLLWAGKYQKVNSRISARLNKRGLLTQRAGGFATKVIYDNYKDAYLYDKDKDGKVKAGGIYARMLNIYMTPADVRGSGNVQLFRLNSPKDRWVLSDMWSYSPGLRRVTRFQGGDRQDEFAGTPLTVDDIGGRQTWEEEHLLIGEDVLYQIALDPQIIAPAREHNTGDFKKDGEWIAKNLDPSRGEELGTNPYRPDGGIECWVVLSRWAKRTENPPFGSHVFPSPKQYYLKYRLTWVEKVTKLGVYSEQYDHSNRLIKWGFMANYMLHPGGFVNGGWAIASYQAYDLRRHFTSWGRYDAFDTGPKNGIVPDDWFTPEHLFREHYWGKMKMKPIKNVEEFAPPPSPFRSKFPKYRKGTQDWFAQEDIDFIRKGYKNHGFTDEEIDALIQGDGVIRKGGKIIPVRKHERPEWIHYGRFPVKFPNE